MQTYKKAVVLLNMGGPNSLGEVESFLKNMFADPCILSIQNKIFRSMIGNTIVNSRIKKSKDIYTALGGGSPITTITFSLTQKLQLEDKDTFYTYAMRYNPPSSYAVLKEIMDKNIKDICLFSMYPQYSSTTTYSSFKDALDSLKMLDYKPTVRIIDRYYDEEVFIQAIINEIKRVLNGDNADDFNLILSAHSIPVSRVKKGDPYKNECESSAKLIEKKLIENNIRFKKIMLGYQSKVGPVKWIGPNTQDLIQNIAKEKIIVYPLSFSIDNSETKYELCMLYKDIANSLGCKDYRVCECLNDGVDSINLIKYLTKQKFEN